MVRRSDDPLPTSIGMVMQGEVNIRADHQLDFRVIDTEGHPLLREVAVIDSHGQLIYEACIHDEEESYYAADLQRPLPDLLRELRPLLQGYRLVARAASKSVSLGCGAGSRPKEVRQRLP